MINLMTFFGNPAPGSLSCVSSIDGELGEHLHAGISSASANSRDLYEHC